MCTANALRQVSWCPYIRPAAPNPGSALILLTLALPLLQVFSTKLSESINAVDGGFITTPNTQELVLQTFTGKVRL